MSRRLRALIRLAGALPVAALTRAAADPEAAQRRYLRRHLRAHRDTEFGREHGFSDIRTVEQYRERVPVRDFEGFRPLVDRLARGAARVLTRQTPFMFAKTSGTTGEPKLVPLTETSRREQAGINRAWWSRALRDHPRLFHDRLLTLVSPAVEGHTPCGLPVGSMSGLTYENNPGVIRRRFVLPARVMALSDPVLRYFVAVRLGLAHRVSFLVAPNPSTLLRLARVAADHRDRLIDAIECGRVGARGLPGEAAWSDADREILADVRRLLAPDPARARALGRAAASRGALSLADAWPTLALIGCWLGGSAGIQAGRLAEAFGDVPCRDIGLRASEATMTVPLDDGTPAGLLSLHANFFEFVPEAEIDDARPSFLMAHELQEGASYYVLLTTSGGLCRYDINDILRVDGFVGRAPLVSFQRKGRDMASLTGEKLHANHLIEAMARCEGADTLRAVSFSMVPRVDAMRYDVLVEPDETVDQEGAERFARRLDDSLGEQNLEYRAKRSSGRLQGPRLLVMRSGWAERQRERDLAGSARDIQYKWAVVRQTWSPESPGDVVLEAQAGP